MDMINDAQGNDAQGIKEDGWLFLRRPSSLTRYLADQKIPSELLLAVPPEEFDKWGNTEWVKTRIRLKTLDAADLAKQVQKLLGPYGEAGVVDGQLTMQDAVGRLRYICRIIQKIDARKPK
jgi:hypothetical protein